MKGKTRQANFEILRILAMLMVITLHYLVKGKVTLSLAEHKDAVNLLAWLIQSACIVAVNVYILISGYFFLEAQWSLKKLWQLVFQVWFYSIGVALLCLGLDVGTVRSWDLYDWAVVIFPFQMEHYWFATAYLVLYLFSPMVKIAIKHLSRKELKTVILSLVLFFSLGKSVIPIQIPTDHYGYDYGWFLCLYLIAGYFRTYGTGWIRSSRRGFFFYVVFVGLIYGGSILLGFFTTKGIPLSYAMDMVHSYNHFLVLLASAGIFCGFQFLRIEKTRVMDCCCRMAPYTFGVYLLHENVAVRDLWPVWFGGEKVRESMLFLPHMLVTVLAVFFIGIMVDSIRNLLFETMEKGLKRFAGRKN